MKLGTLSVSNRVLEYFVVATVVVLAGVLSFFFFSDTLADSRDARRVADIEVMRKALENYYADHGDYPHLGWANSTDESWEKLHRELKSYLPKMPKDPLNDPDGTVERTGSFNYSYYSVDKNAAIGGKKDYVLVLRLERPGHATLASDKNIDVEAVRRALGVATGTDTEGILFLRAP